jgi:transcriptional regulator with GAF, ATPase, and Fis domain
MPEALLESELFGHVKGAFTGADRDRKGLFEIADGGTLFLDEIADTSPAMQAKLLRVVQDGVVRRVGDERTRKVDVRLVTASRVPLAELVATGRFRDDLRYRLDVIGVVMPPLRQRLGDLPALIAHLLHRIAGDRAPRVGKDAARALARYPWPGNVRELENALARAVALGSDPIAVDDLPEAVRGGPAPAPRRGWPPTATSRSSPRSTPSRRPTSSPRWPGPTATRAPRPGCSGCRGSGCRRSSSGSASTSADGAPEAAFARRPGAGARAGPPTAVRSAACRRPCGPCARSARCWSWSRSTT